MRLNLSAASTVRAVSMNIPRLLAASIFIAIPCLAEPPNLSRAEAKRVLEAMDWKGVNFVAVRQGVSAKSEVTPIFATVLALAARDNQSESVCQTLVFDEELGWHHLEMQAEAARIWNKDGYRELRLWTTWWNGVGSTVAPATRP